MLRKKKLSEEQARLKLAALCARSEQCEYDIKSKLFKWGLTQTESSAILEYLIEGNFVDNARFARAFARDKARFSRWGRRKIAMGLAAKRISAEDIRNALEAIDDEEYISALETVAKIKARTLTLTDSKDRQKLYAFLISRGYESSLVSKVVGNLSRNSL